MTTLTGLGAFALFAFVCLSSSPSAHGNVYKSERELRQDIFRGYDKMVRPVKRSTTAVPVALSMTPLALRSMNEKDQIINMDSWIMMRWTDEYLQWDPSEYDNITELRVQPSEIWKPDLALYTAVQTFVAVHAAGKFLNFNYRKVTDWQSFQERIMAILPKNNHESSKGTPDTSLYPMTHTQAIVFNTGMILWVPPFTIMSRCPLPFRNYASARTFVECNIRFGSWTYSGKLMDIQLSTETVDLTNFQDFNREWKLVKIVSNRESKFYPCCPDDYPLVNFNVTLKKRNYYIPGSEN